MHLLNPVTHLKTAFYVILFLASEAIESFFGQSTRRKSMSLQPRSVSVALSDSDFCGLTADFSLPDLDRSTNQLCLSW
jgi:hypothetical protein